MCSSPVSCSGRAAEPAPITDTQSARTPLASIPPEKIQEVRDRIDIERVIGRVVRLKKQGRRLSGLCPFHSEKSPSFSVDPINKLYHCFGCQVGGDAIDFVMRMDSVDFPTAIRQLAAEFGVQLPEREESPEDKRRRSEKEKLYRVNELARAFYEAELTRTPRALEYLEKERSLSKETIARFHLGFAPAGWSHLADELENKRVPIQYPLQLGLVARRTSGRGVYDRLRGRVVFPITLPDGQVAGFGARRADWLEEDDKGPKYLNSPESPIYDKSSIFYGLDLARDDIRKSRQAIMVEGYMDVIALHQASVTTAIACCGTALSNKHAQLLRRMCDEVVTMYDGDAAGVAATRRAAETLLSAGLSVKVLSLPEKDDPDTFVLREGRDALAAVIDSSPSAIDHFTDRARAEHRGAGIAGLVKMVEAVRPLLLAIPDPLARDVSIDGAAKKLELEPRVLRQHLTGRRSPGPAREAPSGPPPGPARGPGRPIPRLELEVLRHLVENPAETLRRLEESEALSLFKSDVVRSTVEIARAIHEEGGVIDAGKVMEVLENTEHSGPDSLRQLRETLVTALPDEHDLNECLKRLTRKAIEARLRVLRNAMTAAEEPSDLARLSEEHRDLTKKLGSLQ